MKKFEVIQKAKSVWEVIDGKQKRISQARFDALMQEKIVSRETKEDGIHFYITERETVELFAFEELPETVQQSLIKKEAASDYGYIYNDEIYYLIKELNNKGLNVNYDFDMYSHRYNFEYCEEELDDLNPIRAKKEAMNLYYALTNKRYAYYKNSNGKYQKTWFEYAENHDGFMYLPNMGSMKKTEKCFTGYYISDIFADALWEGIKQFDTIRDILGHALDAVFDECVRDYAFQHSDEYIREQLIEYDYRYTSSGLQVN